MVIHSVTYHASAFIAHAWSGDLGSVAPKSELTLLLAVDPGVR